jgi:pyridoxal phosphate enzyme (YggS family)
VSLSIAERRVAIETKIAAACARVGRTRNEVTLVGVSKRKPADAIVAAVRAGLRDVGENYVQEAIAKLPEVRAALGAAPPPRFHFIGQLQRNKAGAVARHFDVVQTLDRAALGDALDRRAQTEGRTLEALIQVDVSNEPQKGGARPEDVAALLDASRAWANLRVIGLMTIPAAMPTADAMRPAFAALRELREALRSAPGAEHLTQLSMGMSADYEVAIEEGATIIRVGTALFGARPSPAGGSE